MTNVINSETNVKPTEATLVETREQLEADIKKAVTYITSTAMWPPSANKKTEHLRTTFDEITEWLDRQAAITEQECIESGVTLHGGAEKIRRLKVSNETVKEQNRKLRKERTELRAKVEELTEKLEDFEGDCYCGATVVEWHDLTCKLQEEVDRYESLISCLAKDHGLKASYDDLRGFWNIERAPECAECAEAMGAYADSLCDPLKEQIADLQAEVDELTEERDELLEQVEKYAEEAANFEQALADVEQTHMRLPVDADGVPIRVGETVYGKYLKGYPSFVVRGFEFDTEYDQWNVKTGAAMYTSANLLSHVPSDTVESVLEDFIEAFDAWDNECNHDREELRDKLFAEYAERIRKAVEHD